MFLASAKGVASGICRQNESRENIKDNFIRGLRQQAGALWPVSPSLASFEGFLGRLDGGIDGINAYSLVGTQRDFTAMPPNFDVSRI